MPHGLWDLSSLTRDRTRVPCIVRRILYHWNTREVSVFLLLSFKSSLYILDNSPLSDVSFSNIFSQSVTCFLILLMFSFTEQKFLILNKSRLLVISFMDHVFNVFKKASPDIPGGAVVKNLPASAGNMGSSPGPGRSHMLRRN